MLACVTPEEAPIPTGPSRDERTRERSRSSGTTFEDDPELAELLAAAEREADIPLAAFAAMADVLAYLYRLDAETGPHRAGGDRDVSA
jgi:hypothetical protein